MKRSSDSSSRLNLGALAVSLTDATGISRTEAMQMPYDEFLIAYQDALLVAEERKEDRA